MTMTFEPLPAGVAGPRVKPHVRHRSTHSVLLRDTSNAVVPGKVPLHALIVPAARPGRHLEFAIDLAARVGAVFVALCSRDARMEEVVRRVEAVPAARALVIDARNAAVPDVLDLTTQHADAFLVPNAGRNSDLSLKRNLGLLLARMLDWQRVVFMDDDIYRVSVNDLRHVTHDLYRGKPVAGLLCREFEDNSVVCHANRLSGERQGMFVSGSALGVDTGHPDLAFFPNIYNEDWFFFYQQAAAGTIPMSGYSKQQIFDPYQDPQRAAREEFGDLLAEGLYAGFEDGRGLEAADAAYWEAFIEARRQFMDGIEKRIAERGVAEGWRAVRSIEAARGQLDRLDPQICVQFLEEWRRDLASWRTRLARIGPVREPREALAALGLADVHIKGQMLRA